MFGHNKLGSKLAGEWHSEQAYERANFIAEVMNADPPK